MSTSNKSYCDKVVRDRCESATDGAQLLEEGERLKLNHTDAHDLRLKDLRKSIRNGARTVDILKGLDFTIPRGQFAAIMGASGSGKSTLLGLLAGLDTPSEGSVRLNGTEISYLPEDQAGAGAGKGDWVCLSVVSIDSDADGARECFVAA